MPIAFIASDDPSSLNKIIYEVWNGVDLFFNEPTVLLDGWYWASDAERYGPFADVDAALDAADAASNDSAELCIVDMRGDEDGTSFGAERKTDGWNPA